MACGKGILVRVRSVFNCERLTVTEWQREHGTTKKRRRRSRRSGTSKNHPKKYPEWREAKRRVVSVCGWYFGPLGVFLAVQFTFIFYGKREGLPRRNPRRRPPPTPVI